MFRSSITYTVVQPRSGQLLKQNAIILILFVFYFTNRSECLVHWRKIWSECIYLSNNCKYVICMYAGNPEEREGVFFKMRFTFNWNIFWHFIDVIIQHFLGNKRSFPQTSDCEHTEWYRLGWYSKSAIRTSFPYTLESRINEQVVY